MTGRPVQQASWARDRPAEAIIRDALVMAVRKGREGCQPCVDAYLDLARRNGATDEEITAVVPAVTSSVLGGPGTPVEQA